MAYLRSNFAQKYEKTSRHYATATRLCSARKNHTGIANLRSYGSLPLENSSFMASAGDEEFSMKASRFAESEIAVVQ